MKLTFATKSLAARTFRCVTFGGPVVLEPYRCEEAQPVCTGAVIGQDFHSGADAAQAS